MTSMKVKICGIQGYETGVQVAKLKPDHIGFVFAASRRQVTPEKAAAIIQAIHISIDNSPEMIGVFAQPDRTVLERVLNQVPLEAVQFHAGSDLSIVRWIKDRWPVQVWLTIPVASDTAGDLALQRQVLALQLESLATIKHQVDLILLDTHDPTIGGGSGRVFQWEIIPLYMEASRKLSIPLYVAGGLHSGNVEQLKAAYQVQGVDVSSGVETDGVKDLYKVQSFIERVRA